MFEFGTHVLVLVATCETRGSVATASGQSAAMRTWLAPTATFRLPEDTRGLWFEVKLTRGAQLTFPSTRNDH